MGNMLVYLLLFAYGLILVASIIEMIIVNHEIKKKIDDLDLRITRLEFWVKNHETKI